MPRKKKNTELSQQDSRKYEMIDEEVVSIMNRVRDSEDPEAETEYYLKLLLRRVYHNNNEL
jgi:hypothetical protein